MVYRRRRTVTGAWSKTGTLRRVRRVSTRRRRSPKQPARFWPGTFFVNWVFGPSKTRRKV